MENKIKFWKLKTILNEKKLTIVNQVYIYQLNINLQSV